jgi:hypothetical protein
MLRSGGQTDIGIGGHTSASPEVWKLFALAPQPDGFGVSMQVDRVTSIRGQTPFGHRA